MTDEIVLFVLGTGALLLLTFLLFYLWRIHQNNIIVEDIPSRWENTDYHCPKCGELMSAGFILAGKGMIWAPRDWKRVSVFQNIGQVLENTINVVWPPAMNMSWKCVKCRMIVLDHSKLVRK